MMVKLPFWATNGGIPTTPGIDEECSTALLANAVRAVGTREVALELLGDADPSPWLWELIERWEFRGASQSVMERLFAWFADDEDVMKLGEMLMTTQRWGRRSPIPPRLRGVAVLSGVDSAHARLELLEIQRASPDDLWLAVREFRQRDSDERGITIHEWSDLAAPEFGDAGESALAETRKAWAIRNARHRLEHAMVGGHGWSAERWRRSWHEHSLLAPLTRGLVWIGKGDREVAFLPTAEGDFVDENLDATTLAGVDSVRPAHPLEIDLAKWTEVLATLELIQPVDQLVRGQNVGAARGGERVLRGDRLVAAERWGWQRRTSKLGKTRDIVELDVRNFTVSIYLSDGLSVGKRGRSAGFQPTQSVARVVVRQGDDVVAENDWPAIARAELALLMRRAEL